MLETILFIIGVYLVGRSEAKRKIKRSKRYKGDSRPNRRKK